MVEIEIEFQVRRDGRVAFRVNRPDGTSTWQKHEPDRAAFFVFHDLSHYAVETILNAKDGFFGLLASGWDVGDTSGKGARGSLPPEAVVVEHIVGLLDLERSGCTAPLTAMEISDQLRSRHDAGDIAFVPSITESQLTAIRAQIHDLNTAWGASLAAGTPMLLRYVQPSVSGLSD